MFKINVFNAIENFNGRNIINVYNCNRRKKCESVIITFDLHFLLSVQY